MSNTNKEWLVILLYFLLVIFEGVCEAAWLHLRAWASWPKALLFSWLTNLIGWSIGFAALFVTLGIILAMAWDGSLERLPFKGNEAGVAIVVCCFFLLAVLTLLKRAFLALLKIKKGRGAWGFSVITSLIVWLVPGIVTALLTKLFWRFF